VVARQLGRVCLVGCTSLEIDLARRRCRIGGQEFAEGDALSLDGNQGSIYAGSLAVVAERPERELAIIAGWPGG
jgi:pyruvate,orthophosphate dikinase